MEPFTAGAIATLILTKALEKAGEKLGEKALEQAGKLMQLLKHKSPETAGAIEVVAQRPELAEQQPLDYGEAVLVEKVEKAAEVHPEIKAAIEDLAAKVEVATQNNPQLAEAVKTVIENWQGINIKGGNNTINNPNLNFGSK